MIPRPPANVKDTKIFKKLKDAPNDLDGLAAKANSFIEVATPILDLIHTGPFKSYTLHNRDHAKKLIHIAEHIIDSETINNLTKFECLLIIYSSYLHDMGLVVVDSDIESIIKKEDFKESVRSWSVLFRAIENRREQLKNNVATDTTLIEMELSELHGIALANYLRPQHASIEKYKSLIRMIKDTAGCAELFEIRGVSFEDELIDICVSHNLDASVLAEVISAHEERFLRELIVSDHKANTQFIAAALRLTDILDFDSERTPEILIECLGLKNKNLPGSEVTIKEWQKHLSVQQLVLTKKELVIRSKCKHPAIESSVRSFCKVIESEIRKTRSILRNNIDEVASKYKLIIPSNVRPEIKSQGYVYMDLSLRLDEPAIITLLMGTSLYETPLAAIRELLQNAIDACTVRSRLFPLATYDLSLK